MMRVGDRLWSLQSPYWLTYLLTLTYSIHISYVYPTHGKLKVQEQNFTKVWIALSKVISKFEMNLKLTTNKRTSIVVATYIKPQESSNWVSAPFPRKWSTPDWSYLIKRCPLSVKHDFCVFISNIIKHN